MDVDWPSGCLRKTPVEVGMGVARRERDPETKSFKDGEYASQNSWHWIFKHE